MVIAPAYTSVGIFSEGYCVVRSGNYYGYINAQGEEITRLVYESAQKFSEGLAAVEYGGVWGFIDTTGKLAVELM